MTTPLLEARDITSGFGDYQVLWGVDLTLEEHGITAILGPNGSGKSTMMAALSGVHRSWGGEVLLAGEPVQHLPAHQRVPLGICHVLERRRLFGYLSVRENLLLGATLKQARKHRVASEEHAYSLFPILAERGKQLAHQLSGGEQQMLAIARGLMARPRVLLLDEPLLGLSPAQVEVVADVIRRLRAEGVTILLIEQNVQLALGVADRCVLLRGGQAVLDAPSADLTEDIVMSVYVGGDPGEALRRSREGDTHAGQP
ncbi:MULTISPECIES: ABC transporter ATP-binding protein [unclassified Micromonospora]|uniref:ABC transporter ATP-binding protein n=1 Tax=unclassified Micromonospora TaxID=2617518 RepID=UPI001C37A23F|nr:ABC transporter ATP-binding protein [Verrucosispora sp. NA02020]